LDKFKILSENQAGFRTNHSTLDHTFTLKFLIDFLRAQKQKLYVGYVDFKSCFDLIPRFELFHKLINAGIDGKKLRIIKNILCTT